jgi:hypothetical protein
MADPTANFSLAIDATGDIEITTDTADGGLRLTSGLEAATDNLNSFLQLWRGTWFRDLLLGVPWLQDILGEEFDEAVVLAIFREAIFEEEHVVSIQTISATFNKSTRVLTTYFEVLTEFGVVSNTVEV